MRLFARLRRSERAAAALEFALAAPALIAMIIGIAQLGILYLANAGLRNAVAEGARFATIWRADLSPARRPTDAEIRTRILNSEFGLIPANMTTPSITHGVDSGANYVDISVSYTVPLNFIFFEIPDVTLTESRRAYVQPT